MVVINCFNFDINSRQYILNIFGDQFNLKFHNLELNNPHYDELNIKNFLLHSCRKYKTIHHTPIIVCTNSIELFEFEGYPGSTVNSILKKNKLTRFSSIFNNQNGIFRFGIMYYNNDNDYHYYDKTIHGSVKAHKTNILNLYNIFYPINNSIPSRHSLRCISKYIADKTRYNIYIPINKLLNELKSKYLLY